MSDKLKVLVHTDSSLAKTGFGRNARAILSHLYNTKKYELVHYCIGTQENSPVLKKTPWRSVGCLPSNQSELERINRDPTFARMAGYGSYFIDKVIDEEKPDVYIGAQDIWGLDYTVDKFWFNKIPSVIWTTLDSLPLLPTAVEKAKSIKDYWIWADFATKEMHRLGHKHVRTMRGSVDTQFFHKLPDSEKTELRKRHGISEDVFIIGFVFRNQLRKTIYSLLEGFKMFKSREPKAQRAKLLLHTHFSEGWDIPKLASEYGVDMEDILTTYVCRTCKSYFIATFQGQDKKCPACGSEKEAGLITTNTNNGVTESQLNEVYNLMNVYCHPFTSGGQEIPIQEAKLTELITLVTNYSCGEDLCVDEACSIPLDWKAYREPNTQFIKAQTHESSISKQLAKVFKMKPAQRKKMGENAREWVINNFSVEVISKQIEDFLDGCEKTDFDFKNTEEKKDPNIQIPTGLSDKDWLIWMYHNILKMEHVDEKDDGYKYWTQELEKGTDKKQIEDYFRHVAVNENSKGDNKGDLTDVLDEDDDGKRMLYVMPEAIGDIYISTSLFRSMKEQYPDYNLYVAVRPEFAEVLDGNPYVHKTIPYAPQMDSLPWLEGSKTHKGYFKIAFLPFVNTQKILTWMHNGLTNIAYKDLRYENALD